MPTRESFAITFTAADPHDPPTIQRVRRLLKAALRSYGLRCTYIVDVTPAPDDAPSSPAKARPARRTTPPLSCLSDALATHSLRPDAMR